MDLIKDRDEEHKILFLQSWNEWGEGAFLEPDTRYQYRKLEAIKEALE